MKFITLRHAPNENVCTHFGTVYPQVVFHKLNTMDILSKTNNSCLCIDIKYISHETNLSLFSLLDHFLIFFAIPYLRKATPWQNIYELNFDQQTQCTIFYLFDFLLVESEIDLPSYSTTMDFMQSFFPGFVLPKKKFMLTEMQPLIDFAAQRQATGDHEFIWKLATFLAQNYQKSKQNNLTEDFDYLQAVIHAFKAITKVNSKYYTQSRAILFDLYQSPVFEPQNAEEQLQFSQLKFKLALNSETNQVITDKLAAELMGNQLGTITLSGIKKNAKSLLGLFSMINQQQHDMRDLKAKNNSLTKALQETKSLTR